MYYIKRFMHSALVVAFFLGYIPALSAAPVRWTFEDAWFNDGTPLRGSFIYDAAVSGEFDRITGWSFRTYDTEAMAGATYSDVNGESRYYEEEAVAIWFWPGPVNESDREFVVSFLPEQWSDPNRADVPIYGMHEFVEVGDGRWCCPEGPDGCTDVCGGRIVRSNPIPIPTTLFLLGTGLIGLGWFKFRRRKK